MRQLQVGRQTAGFISRGHPWIRTDRFLGSMQGMKPGEAITLIDDKKKPLASALADPNADDGIVARVYDSRPGKPFNPTLAITRAAEKRASLLKSSETNCFRLVHGEADFLPGVRVECYGTCAVLLLRSQAAVQYIDILVPAIKDILGHDNIIIRQQVTDLRRQHVQTTHAAGRTIQPEKNYEGKELGLTYDINPENDLATGIYVDMRGPRQWLQKLIQERLALGLGTKTINLFAYTGIFSTAALAAGAENAIDIDLSGPALATAQQNADKNKVADRHSIIQGDCLEALKNLPQDSCDLLICDPPTAAGGNAGKVAASRKQKGWVTRRDYPQLLEACDRALKPRGMLIAACNTLGRKAFDLHKATDHIGTATKAPDLALDIPQKRGFPEGRPYQLVVRHLV